MSFFSKLIITWLITAVGVYFAATVVDGIQVKGLGTALIAALVIGLLNAILKPILIFFSIPFIALTLGLFLIVINAFLLLLAGYFVSEFKIQGFLPALYGSVIISIISWLLGLIIMPKRN